jgi:hypothetical protein
MLQFVKGIVIACCNILVFTLTRNAFNILDKRFAIAKRSCRSLNNNDVPIPYQVVSHIHQPDRNRVKKAVWISISVLCLIVSSCGSIDVSSTFRSRDITIDADAMDWHGLPLYTEKKLSFAVSNDSTYLYLLITTSDRTLQRQLSVSGVNLWFDAKGGSEKSYGIHYPMPSPGAFGMQRDRGTGSMRGGRGDGQGQAVEMQGEEPGEPPRMMDVNSSEMEILGPGNDKEILALAEAKDLQLKMSSASGLLIFELRVPLVRDPLHPHGIGTSLAAALGVGMETPEFDFPKSAMGERGGMQPPGGQEGEGGEMGGGMPPGGMGGGRGGPGGGGHRGGSPGGGSRPGSESVSLWANVKLAVK